MSGFACLECGRKFKTVKAAERAASDGCPGCGGVDIDIDVNASAEELERERVRRVQDRLTYGSHRPEAQ
jgi:hypothetical protein